MALITLEATDNGFHTLELVTSLRKWWPDIAGSLSTFTGGRFYFDAARGEWRSESSYEAPNSFGHVEDVVLILTETLEGTFVTGIEHYRVSNGVHIPIGTIQIDPSIAPLLSTFSESAYYIGGDVDATVSCTDVGLNIGELLFAHGLEVQGGVGEDYIEYNYGVLWNSPSLGMLAYGRGGNDNIWGTEANDTIHGDEGNDFIDGSAGADLLYGGAGNDFIRGGLEEPGNDRIFGGDGNDRIEASSLGRHRLFGEGGNDVIGGGEGIDWAYGGVGNDRINGYSGNDMLFGDAGRDTLDGGYGRDTLTGGANKDEMTGGAGADIFVFNTATDSGRGLAADIINDFQRGADKLDFSAIQSGMTYIGAAVFAGAAGSIRYDKSSGLINVDLDGDKAADFSVLLFNGANISATDFIL